MSLSRRLSGTLFLVDRYLVRLRLKQKKCNDSILLQNEEGGKLPMFKLPSYWIYRRQKGTYRPIIYVFGFNEQLVRDMLLSLEVNDGRADVYYVCTFNDRLLDSRNLVKGVDE